MTPVNWGNPSLGVPHTKLHPKNMEITFCRFIPQQTATFKSAG